MDGGANAGAWLYPGVHRNPSGFRLSKEETDVACIMQSSKANTSSGTQTKQAASQAQTGASSSTQWKDPTTGWTLEEMLETGMDENGNPVPDAVSYIDGKRMAKGEKGFDDQGDPVSAANDDFD
ncbi:hypothetical protein BJX61DRAFT_543294 [Aspergillus egyptiacus]|nr:hypothetical protein BJX61DRAFT_543294 [Aspergillus egyptiacus]